MRGRKTLVAMLSLAGLLATGTAANADVRPAQQWNCFGSQNVCFFYGTFNQGAHVYFSPGVADPNLADNVFDQGDADETGFGQPVAGNIRSVSNYSDNFAVVLCTGVNYTGVCRLVAPSSDWPGDPYLQTVRSFRWGV